jgi:hypothetical protein
VKSRGSKAPRRAAWSLALAGLVPSLFSCGVGRGDGFVKSDDLLVEGCIDGPYSMDPNYFAASYDDDSHLIRIQRGNSPTANSDALLIVVHDVEEIIESQLGVAIPVTVAPELLPEGVVSGGERSRVSITLHLGRSCEEEVVSLQAISGTITFDDLFDGDVGSASKKERLMEGSFEVTLADPRDLVSDESSETGYSATSSSTLYGSFSFTYRRGQPAQTFP